MKIRHRLSIISSLVFGIVFALASALVYFFYYKSSENMIYDELATASRLTAFFYLEEDELPSKEHKEIEVEFLGILQKNIEVRVFNERNQITYGNLVESEVITASVLDRVRKEKNVRFRKNDNYYNGIFYPDNQGDFVIFVKENNTKIREISRMLLFVIFIVMLIGLIMIIFASRLVSEIAYRPISKVIKEVNELDLDSLDKSLTSPGTSDEIEELISTFNNLLLRISESIVIQKNFINYVSHEFKTPLASISGHLEVFSETPGNDKAIHDKVVTEVIENVHQIKKIMDTLMRLSGLRKEKIKPRPFKVDELLWKIIEEDKMDKYNQVHVILDRGMPEENLTVYADFDELQMAVRNILDNAIKYSEGQPVEVHLSIIDGRPVISIKDQGVGIPDQDFQFIKQPFYRGSNVRDLKGSGIGLSIAGIILMKNNVVFDIRSKEGKGTVVTMKF